MTPHQNPMPLVTLAVTCFNQEAFIATTLRGALAQTYRPLEIVIVDDASTDGSRAAIARAMEEAPADVTVTFHANERNRGRLGNVPVIGGLAHGALIVWNDGDDVSHPNRVARLVAAWQADGARATVLSHGVRKIGPDGSFRGYMHAHALRYPLGAAMAYCREAFTAFGPVLDGTIVQDETLTRRALMLGPGLIVDEPLVDYRVGAGISSRGAHVREPIIRCSRALFATFRQVRADLEAAQTRLGEASCRAWRARLDREEEETRLYLELLESASFLRRFKAWRRYPKPPVFSFTSLQLLFFLLPRALGDLCADALKKIRQACRV